jgi:exosome complex RNA-binding protein Csl4
MDQHQDMVLPGDRLATEEEFSLADNVYSENGDIYAAIIGKRVESAGTIKVSGAGKEIRKLQRGMVILGRVAGVLPAVVFVKIDGYESKGVHYVAIKDGKIVMPKTMSRGRDSHGPPGRRDSEKETPFCIGDIIIARIYKEDDDIYELDVRTPDEGVVYAKCGECGGELETKPNSRLLSCVRCRAVQTRRISTLYGKAEAIRKLFE